MDITLQPIPVATQFHPTPSAKAATDDTTPNSTPQATVPAVTADTVTISSPANVPSNTAAQQAILSFKNVYAVSDKDFTMFKDATGKLITRYVSLRDGTVSYEPSAPTYVRPQPSANGSSSLTISA